MTKYTKGPWSVKPALGPNLIRIEDADSVAICATKTEANAHLIAAAPDLLESLHDMLFLFDGLATQAKYTHTIEDIFGDLNVAIAIRNAAKEAVDKANGGAA